MITLALNVAEPVIAGQYGKAAFDAVGPLLLIGWSEVGPGLLQHLKPQNSQLAPVPDQSTPASALPPARTESPVGGDGSWCLDPQEFVVVNGGTTNTSRLLEQARREDALHWASHHRPISAETLRKRLHIGAGKARTLVTDLRRENTHRVSGVARGSLTASA
ncbi:hypothetical protein [Embleya sp. NPDC050493]|uniref:hypothetical protein n=1 Tax=Embleya sp. NPDC050493 TaxID=3363989 RepID=UPI0037B8C6EC